MSHPHRIEGADQNLVARIRLGDEAAFAALFREYYSGLCSYANARTRSPADAEELVMDVFRRLWERRTQWTVTTMEHYDRGLPPSYSALDSGGALRRALIRKLAGVHHFRGSFPPRAPN